MDSIKVKVTKHGKRKFLVMYYDDPITGKREQRSTKTSKRREAEREAAKWEAALREGRYKPPSKITWQEFRERYEDEVLLSLAKRTDNIVTTVFNSVERIINPQKLSDLNTDRLSYYQAELRNGELSSKKGKGKLRSEDTIRTYLKHLKASLSWAVDLGMIASVPKVKMPKRAGKGDKVMKGRPITGEEFERLVQSVSQGLVELSGDNDSQQAQRKRLRAAKIAPEVVASWERLLTGLWLSGLRLGEAVNLSWDMDDKLTVDFNSRRPMFRIPGEMEKGNQDRLLPMTPDFAEFLETTPQDDRTGLIFNLFGVRGKPCRDFDWISRIIVRIGTAAGVKVNTDAQGKVKYASAHDLRRSFGTRWAPRVMPIVLKDLMRHDSIETTMKYYMGQNAEAMADQIWEAAEKVDTSVDTKPNRVKTSSNRKAANSFR